jgi:hypothetical protein
MIKEIMQKNKTATSLIGVLLVVLLIAIIFLVYFNFAFSPQKNSKIGLKPNAGTIRKAPVVLRAAIDKQFTISKDGKLTIKVSLSGMKNQGGARANGAAINFYNVPSFLSNPQITVADSSWGVKSSPIKDGRVVFIAEGLSSPLVSNQNDFFTITFDAKGAAASQMEASIEITDDNVPSMSHQSFFKSISINK